MSKVFQNQLRSKQESSDSKAHETVGTNNWPDSSSGRLSIIQLNLHFKKRVISQIECFKFYLSCTNEDTPLKGWNRATQEILLELDTKRALISTSSITNRLVTPVKYCKVILFWRYFFRFKFEAFAAVMK